MSTDRIWPAACRATSWLDPPTKFSSFRTSPALPRMADVVIIGAGFSGVSVAYHLLKLNPGMNVVLLEAGNVCDGASGRNGGHLSPDLYSYTSTLTATHGSDEAIRHNQFERANFEAIKKLVQDETIECEMAGGNGESWRVFMTEQEFANGLRELTMMRDIGGDVHDVKVYQKEQARKITGIPSCFGAIASPASPISTPKLVTKLLEKSLVKGLNLQTYTQVLDIKHNAPLSPSSSTYCQRDQGLDVNDHKEDSDSDEFEHIESSLRISPKISTCKHRIVTNRGELLTNNVVHATNAHLDRLLAISSHLRDRFDRESVLVAPVRGHVIEISTGGTSSRHARKLSLDPAVNITNMTFNNSGTEYIVQRPDGNFVLGGGRRFGRRHGVETFNSFSMPEYEIDVNVDYFLRSFFTQTLAYDPGRYLSPSTTTTAQAELDGDYSTRYKIEKQWTGIMGYSTDNFPLVGKLPALLDNDGQEYCIAGFTSHGMPRIFLSARFLAQKILHEDEEYSYDVAYHKSLLAGRSGDSFFTGELEENAAAVTAAKGSVEFPRAFEISEDRLSRMINGSSL
ncbi:FAD dependent oxidoreductase [Lipomyces japonicus]|uniref:FAD dependent oxidoreductase n=1 Tax=Lipomyces japonicus TaxID=56871 RepID=UPI0034CD8B58